MPDVKVPTTIGELLASAGQAIANINQHRAAMADVAAQAKVPKPVQPETESAK